MAFGDRRASLTLEIVEWKRQGLLEDAYLGRALLAPRSCVSFGWACHRANLTWTSTKNPQSLRHHLDRQRLSTDELPVGEGWWNGRTLYRLADSHLAGLHDAHARIVDVRAVV